MSSHAQDERRALVALLREVGPDAPTRCAGWTARDLAAHLVLRERRPDAAAGILLSPLAGYTESVQRSIRDGRSWEQLVDAVAAGPPALLRPLDEPVNTVEYFVHHEDVRRAAPGWAPRPLDAELEGALWARVRMLARLVARRVPAGPGVTIEAPGHGVVTARRGSPMVTVTGPPGELVLFLTGRGEVARVEVDGPAAAVAAVRGARFGL